MASPKRIVLFVEGEADETAVPVLAARMLKDWGVWEAFVDDKPFLVGNVADVTKDDGKDWVNYLRRAAKRPNLGAVLLLLDGDIDPVGKGKEPFCAARFAARLAAWSTVVGAGKLFSVACVFARQEIESWFLACLDRLAGQRLPDGRAGVKAGSPCPGGNLEIAPRDAKGALKTVMEHGYKQTRDMALLMRLAANHLDAIRARPMRDFLRFEHALQEVVEAIRSGRPLVSPIWPRPTPPEAAAPAESDLTDDQP